MRKPREGVLVAALVAVPAAAIMLISTVMASQTPTLDEKLTAELGQTQAWVRVWDSAGNPVVQAPTVPEHVQSAVEGDGALEGTDEYTAAEVEALLPDGARTIDLLGASTFLHTPDASARATLTAGEAWDESLAGIYTLVDGSVPAADDEIMISPTLASVAGVAVGDAVELADTGEYTVVGILSPRVDGSGTVFTTSGAPVAVGALGEWGINGSMTWYLVDTPLSWSDVQELNRQGLVAYSREVVTGPPVTGGLTPIEQETDAALLGAGAVGLFAAMLLAGAAFAVTFRRQRHTMAMLGANGAHGSSLVAVGVARGLWLGLAGGVVGGVFGIALGLGWDYVLLHWGGAEGQYSTWGYHVNWSHLPLTAAYGALVGIVSAWVPALAASRLDVLGVLRGSTRPPRARRWTAVLGALAVIAGGAAMAWSARLLDQSLDLAGGAAYAQRSQASMILVAGAVLAFGGLALLVPVMLRLLGRAAVNAPLAGRIAVRDASRSIGRTAPVVAAIAVTIAISTGLILTLDRGRANLLDYWTPHAPVGDAIVELGFAIEGTADQADIVVAAAHDVLPDAEVTVFDAFLNFNGVEPGAVDMSAVPFLLAPEQNVCPELIDPEFSVSARERAADPRCDSREIDFGPWTSRIVVGDADDLAALAGTDPGDAALDALAGGGVVVFSSSFLDEGTVTVGFYDVDGGEFPDFGSLPDESLTLPGAFQQVAPGTMRVGLAMVSPETAAEIGWPSQPTSVLIDADEPITEQQQAQLSAAARMPDGSTPWVYVGGGPRDTYAAVVSAAIMGVALLLVFSSVSIALGLARADARQDDFTLASLGASPQLARSVAAWQGALIVGLAGAIGAPVGTAWVVVQGFSTLDRDYVLPWWWIVAASLALTGVVALAAWVFTKVPKAVHYRLAA
ncbi:FtsX-like permease family protein [Demequina sp. NBRC 110052]|uniref:FtsX-like permease family protein n=1 Tax=Demequina sp. NBRC 110052 TaxID=1570341 RepID=UPI0011814D23|nr:FtsX-like permease family protein [Demequina sp. NBRC 110052]